jgi:hypothetical protein
MMNSVFQCAFIVCLFHSAMVWAADPIWESPRLPATMPWGVAGANAPKIAKAMPKSVGSAKKKVKKVATAVKRTTKAATKEVARTSAKKTKTKK